MSIMSVSNSRAAALVNPYACQNTTDKSAGTTNATADLSGVLSSNSEGDTYQMTPIPPASTTYTSTGADYDTGADDAVANTLAAAAKLYNNLDTDGDGTVSQAEFVSARPDDVTEEMATQLYSSLDTDSSGTLSESEFAVMANNNASSGSAGSISSDTLISALYDNLDTDGDGTISQAEFLAARPDDVSEEMATQLYSSLDTDSSGALSSSEVAAVLNNTLASTTTVQSLPDMSAADIDRVAKA